MISTSNKNRLLTIFLLAAILVSSAAIRFRLLDLPLERDEGEYAYFAQLILKGIPPYIHAYSMKLPGVYGAYAIAMKLFGETPHGIHLGLLSINAATIILMFMLSRRLFDTLTGIATSASYAILSLCPEVYGLAAHATHFIVLFALAGMLLLLVAIESGRWPVFLSCGLMLGAAFIMKQNGLLFALFALLYLVWNGARRHQDWQSMRLKTISVLIGVMIPFSLICIFLYKVGSFDKFWFWTFKYAREYSSGLPASQGGANFIFTTSRIIGATFPIWILAVCGLGGLFLDRQMRSKSGFVIGFVLFSFLAVLPGLYFRGHYFILVLPAVSLLAGIAVKYFNTILSGKNLSYSGLLSVSPLLAAIAYIIIVHKIIYFVASPLEVSRMMYGKNPFPESLQIAEYIKSRTSKDDRIAVIGSEPQIYFYSDRISASGHIYMYGLTEKQKYAGQMQHEMIEEVEKAKPEYVVYVIARASWYEKAEWDKSIIYWADNYLHKYYERVGVVDIIDNNKTLYLWDTEALHYSPVSTSYLLVFKRNRM